MNHNVVVEWAPFAFKPGVVSMTPNSSQHQRRFRTGFCRTSTGSSGGNS